MVDQGIRTLHRSIAQQKVSKVNESDGQARIANELHGAWQFVHSSTMLASFIACFVRLNTNNIHYTSFVN